MSKMKTSDIWPKGYKLTFDYCPSNTSTDETFGFIFSSSEPCIFICDVVNNHDRMAEEIAELKSHLENLVTESIALAQFKNDTLRGNIRSTDLDEPEWHDYQTIGEAGAYLAKLNQEGEE